MMNKLLINSGKLLSKFITLTNLGNGSTWPGHIALKFNPHFISDIVKDSRMKVIFIIGTNGKTTTTTILSHILSSNNYLVIQNTSGANLINGIASTLILNTNITGKLIADYALFEIDENAFPLACKQITPDIVIILNLFRDQLDRYGEVNTIAEKWAQSLIKLPKSTKIFLNADDPQIASLGRDALQEMYYYGLDEKGKDTIDLITDSNYCPKCGSKLIYTKTYYSHLGLWSCPSGDNKRPETDITSAPLYPLHGTYNKYNTIAAYATAIQLNIPSEKILTSLGSFKPAFGRQEKIAINDKYIEVILAKNPAGFNQTLETILKVKPNNLLLLLNDRIADGQDVSWIWDVNFEMLHKKNISITISGDRAYDLGLRLKYAEVFSIIEPSIAQAVRISLKKTPVNETLFIVPTYTAMLEVRKILTGKKIL